MIKAYHQVLDGFKRSECSKHTSMSQGNEGMSEGEESSFGEHMADSIRVPNFRNQQTQTDLTFMETPTSSLDALLWRAYSGEEHVDASSYRTLRELNREVHRGLLSAKQHHREYVSELSGIKEWKISHRKRRKNFIEINRRKIMERASRYSTPIKMPWR